MVTVYGPMPGILCGGSIVTLCCGMVTDGAGVLVCNSGGNVVGYMVTGSGTWLYGDIVTLNGADR